VRRVCADETGVEAEASRGSCTGVEASQLSRLAGCGGDDDGGYHSGVGTCVRQT
jgi:hypothetical protein